MYFYRSLLHPQKVGYLFDYTKSITSEMLFTSVL